MSLSSNFMIQTVLNQQWKDARWDISGAFAHDRELLAFHDFLYTLTGKNIFDSVHGSPLFEWNSGRVLPRFSVNPYQMKVALDSYMLRGIPIDYTFTNTLLGPQHLDNLLGNNLLKYAVANNPTGRNAVIVASDVLYDYIKKEYPSLKLVSSILKISSERGKGDLDYYLRLADRFDKVMLHPDDTLNLELLEKLPNKEKYEALINEYCIRNCPIRHLHYQQLSEQSLAYSVYAEDDFLKMREKNGCTDFNHLCSNGAKETLALKPVEIKAIYDLGFRIFKVQGRGLANASGIIFDLMNLVLGSDSDEQNGLHRLKIQFLELLAGYKAPEFKLEG